MDDKIKAFDKRCPTFHFLHDNMEKHSEEILAAAKRCFVDVKTAFGLMGDELLAPSQVTRNPFCDSAASFINAMDNVGGEARNEIIQLCALEDPEIADDNIELLRCFYDKEVVRWGKNTRKLKIRIDCDASKSSHVAPQGVVDMYDALWPDIISNEKIKESISADTMNSFFALYQGVTGASMWSRNTINKKAIEDKGSPELAKRFELYAHLTHTAGNFILCYGSFNRDRRNPTKDFWDLTLECINEWYLSTEPPSKNHLNQGPLDKCAPWLNFFGEDAERGPEQGLRKWRGFVERNFLEVYVDNSSKEMPVLPFFPGHTFEGKGSSAAGKTLLPEGEQQTAKCLDAINACIIVRCNKIREELHGKLNDGEKKDKAKSALKLLFGA